MVPQFFVGVINTIECPVISTSMQNQGIGYLEKPHYIYFKPWDYNFIYWRGLQNVINIKSIVVSLE